MPTVVSTIIQLRPPLVVLNKFAFPPAPLTLPRSVTNAVKEFFAAIPDNKYGNPVVGIYEVDFDGSGFSSGVYFYRLYTQGFNDTKRMILIK